jgi:signal transduction histidine kinase
LREADPLKRAMERAVDQAEAALVEGRDSVRGLRVLAHRDLADALAAIGAEFATQSKARLRVSVEGTLRALQPLARDELYRIGREAIVNALRHAAPGQIDVTLAFGEEGFRLLVSDDGTGIDAAVMKAGIRPGHFGLPGMRERIGRIGGMIDIRPGSVSGTEVLVTLPRKAAYLRKKRA